MSEHVALGLIKMNGAWCSRSCRGVLFAIGLPSRHFAGRGEMVWSCSASLAIAMACARVATRNLVKMLDTLLRMVFSLSPSISATSGFVIWSAISRRISVSRAVNCGNAAVSCV